MIPATLGEALTQGIGTLKQHTCAGSDAEREALELLAFAADIPKDTINLEQTLSDSSEITTLFQDLLARRLEHEPIAYLLGNSPFLGRTFEVTKDTLIPRPATELIVEKVIADLRETPADIAVDIGTGSGCIAISLAAELPEIHTFATDVSVKAIEVAKRNAKNYDVENNLTFAEGTTLSPVIPQLKEAKRIAIIANLPYIPTAQMKELDPDVSRYEPSLALDGGEDGLDLYREFLDQLLTLSAPKQIRLYAEILPEQFESLEKEISSRFKDAQIERITAPPTAVLGLYAEIEIT